MDKPQKPTHQIIHEMSFNSLHQLLDHIATADSPLTDNQRASMCNTDGEWAGTDSLTTALELARFGWPEGLKKIRTIMAQVKVNFPEIFPRQDASDEIVKGVIGNYEDPTLDDSPDPENMFRFKPKFDEIKYGSILQRIIIECSASAYVEPETMFLRGAAILALIEQLEQYGFRIEVILQDTRARGRWGDDKAQELTVTRTVIKAFDEHSDYDAFAFCIANPAFLRRLMFATNETFPIKVIKDFGFSTNGCYACPHNHPMYIDPVRDFYMVRPLRNMELDEVITDTVRILNERYKGMIEDNHNPNLEGFTGEGGINNYGGKQEGEDND